jgi:hypothetical protein
MKKIALVLIGIVVAAAAYAQAVMQDNLRAATTLDRLSNFQGHNTADLLYGIPMPPGKIIGDTYLSQDWKMATVLLYADNKIIEGFPVRYDIAANELEFNAKNGIKVLSGEKIKSFVWMDADTKVPSYFINGKEFKDSDNVPYVGFFQVLSDGKMPLMKRTKVTIKKPDYNVALNVGSADEKIFKSVMICYSKENKISKIPSSNKKGIPVFGEKSAEVKKFVEDNALSFGEEDELIKIFDFYNGLYK